MGEASLHQLGIRHPPLEHLGGRPTHVNQVAQVSLEVAEGVGRPVAKVGYVPQADPAFKF